MQLLHELLTQVSKIVELPRHGAMAIAQASNCVKRSAPNLGADTNTLRQYLPSGTEWWLNSETQSIKMESISLDDAQKDAMLQKGLLPYAKAVSQELYLALYWDDGQRRTRAKAVSQLGQDVEFNLHAFKPSSVGKVMGVVTEANENARIVKPTTPAAVCDLYLTKAFDRKFLKDFTRFCDRCFYMNDKNAELLTSSLIGVVSGIFPNKWVVELIELLEIDDISGYEADWSDIPTIPTNAETIRSVPYSLLFLVAYKFTNSDILRKEEKEEGCRLAIKLMLFRMLSGLTQSDRFKYGAKEDVAIAAFESLKLKSLIKVYGSWDRLLDALAENITSEDSKHRVELETGENTSIPHYVISDAQTTIRKIFNRFTEAYYRADKNTNRIMRESATYLNAEGEMQIKDITNKTSHVQRRLKSLVKDQRAFIDDKAISVVLRLSPTADERHLRSALEVVYEKANKGDQVNDLIDNVTVLLAELTRTQNVNSLELLEKTRGLFRSSQVTRRDVIEIREQVDALISKTFEKRPQGVLSSTRIAIILYLSILSLLP